MDTEILYVGSYFCQYISPDTISFNQRLTRIPVLIGEGIPLFGPLAHDVKLQHLSTRTFENGLVQSTYQVINAA